MPPTYTGVLTPVDNFSGRNKVNFGVGEEINLTAKVAPTTTPATPMTWSVKSGSATVTNTGTTGIAKVKCGAVGGAVVLELRKTTGDKALLGTQRLQVLAPTGAEFEKDGSDYHVKNTASAGFVGSIYLVPKTVSFKWLEMREGAAPHEGTGCFAKREVSLKKLRTNSAVIHPIMGGWVDCLGATSAKGTAVNGQDTVATIIGAWGAGGTFTWNIPWYYRVAGSSEEHRFCTAVHSVDIDAAGKMSITKLNVTVTKNAADSDSRADLL